MTGFTIDIVSDTVCPWCYVGHKRLSSAIQTHLQANPSDSFTTRWLPYQLQPGFQRGQSIDKIQYFNSRFGEQQAQTIHARLTSIGEAVGIKFKFGGKTGSTWDSHRLIEYAHQQGKGEPKSGNTNLNGVQTRLVEELFADYFEKEQDITSHDVLTKAAVRAGLDEGEVKQMLGSDQYGDTVGKELKRAQMEGVSGVPHFMIQGQYEISGGQEPAAFLQIFKRVKQQEGA